MDKIKSSVITAQYCATLAGRLPSEYQQVEYIWSKSGNPYIKTGFVPTQRFKTVIKVQYRAANGLVACGAFETNGRSMVSYGIWGASSGGNQYGFQNPVSDFSTYIRVDFAPFWSGTPEDAILTEDWITPLYKVETNSGTYTSTPNNYFPNFGTAEFFLCARNVNGQARNDGAVKIYFAKFYDYSGTLVRNYVPCYRKSDNKPGMYDLVNGTFNVSANSQEFTVGADV